MNSGKTLSRVKDFLDSRSQAVVLNGVKSDKIAISSGVPQGSVPGPILFLAYINDLPDQVKSRVRLFADDTAIYLAISSEGESITLQNDLLHTLEIWEKQWDMSFNPSKCQVLHITRAKCPIQTRYIQINTRKKLFFSRFAAEHPLREIFFSRRKIKITYFAEGFLREHSQRNSAKVRGETPRHFAENLREFSRWVVKDIWFLNADSEDSDQTEKLSECPA